ncbi:MAG: hypothetical protein CL596_10045 [Alteromonas sp.]|nr:hypothetical protein [Alteromonas sp.]MAY21548.1 hypothetical protein [Flavobacteriaceae bacterium]|tara:strand:+ start:46593 stop:46778 length:186 start_codon:yes stop_codon:yes gene_type:complete
MGTFLIQGTSLSNGTAYFKVANPLSPLYKKELLKILGVDITSVRKYRDKKSPEPKSGAFAN